MPQINCGVESDLKFSWITDRINHLSRSTNRECDRTIADTRREREARSPRLYPSGTLREQSGVEKLSRANKFAYRLSTKIFHKHH